MCRGKRVRRRPRRASGLLTHLLTVPVILLIGVMLAAALFPYTVQARADADAAAERLANQLAGSTEPSAVQGEALPAPAQKGSIPSLAVPDWIIQDILPVNEYSRPGTKLDGVTGVVVHYTGNPGTTAQQNRSYFGNLAQTRETYASSHFVIGMDGTVIQCVPLNEVAYCSSQRNSDTISIECCHGDESGEFSPQTLDALTRLLNWLIGTYQLDRTAILRHYDVTGKECPRYHVEHPEAWTGLLDGLTF